MSVHVFPAVTYTPLARWMGSVHLCQGDFYNLTVGGYWYALYAPVPRLGHAAVVHQGLDRCGTRGVGIHSTRNERSCTNQTSTRRMLHFLLLGFKTTRHSTFILYLYTSVRKHKHV
jgi:hypothetical protein